MSSTLLSKKSTLTSRRNIVIYIIATILILGIVAGFSNTFHTDNTRHSAGYGEVIVMEAEPPASGTPSDYDLLSNLRFTAYKIRHSKYFKGFTDGIVSADIGIGSYTQHLTNTRIVYNKSETDSIVFAETISSSSLKSLAEQKYIDNDIVIFRPADKISGDGVTYKSTAVQMSFDDFSDKYGSIPNQLSKYIINEQTILSVKDENATKVAPLNSDGSDVGFDVPDKLVPNADGNYVFTLTLDPTESSKYYRNEVRTLGGADQNPKFYSVKVTVTVNSEWIPLSTRTLEEYDIEIPVLGAMRCSGDNYEEFSMIDDPNGEIPEQDFFRPYVDEAKSKPGYVPPTVNIDGPLSASDYLAAAFACYLSGEKNLDLAANIDIDGIPVLGKLSAYDLTLSVNLNTLDIQAMLGDGLYVKYGDGKVYIKNNDINGYIDTKDIDKLTNDEALKGLLGGIGELDTAAIFGGDMLDVIFRNCEMTTEDGVTKIPMSFTLDLSSVVPAPGSVKVDASIMINDGDKSLKSIIGTVTVGEVVIDIDVQPLAAAPAFPTTEGAVDLSGIIDFVPDVLSTATQKTYGIDGEITLNDMTVGVSAYIDRTDGLKADATLNVSGLNVNVKYVDGIIYIDALGVNVRGTVDELPALLEAALDLTGFSKYQNLLKAMLPSSVNEIADMLKTLTVDDDTLNVGLKFIGIPIDVKLTRSSGKLDALALSVNVDLFGIKANVAADLAFSEPEVREVKAPATDETYLTFADLALLITDVKPYLQDSANYTAKIDGSVEISGAKTEIGGSFVIDKILDKNKNVTGVAADGTLDVLGQNIAVTYVDGAAYVTIGKINAKLDLTDANSLMSSVIELVKLVMGNDAQLPNLDIIDMLNAGAVKSASMKGGTLNISLDIDGYNVTITLNLKSGKIGMTAKLDDVSVKLDITVAAVKSSHSIKAPSGTFINIAELSALIDSAAAIIEQKSLVIPTSITAGGNTYNASVAVDFSDGIKAKITVSEFGLDIVLLGDTVYLSIGEIRLCGSVAEAKALYNEVRKQYSELPSLDGIIALPQDLDVAGIISTALGAIESLEAKDGIITADIVYDGFGVSASFSADLSEITISTNGITITMSPEVKGVTIEGPSGAYNSIAQLTTLVPTIFELADSTSFGIAYDASALGYNVDGNAVLSVADGIKANATANAFGQTINISYIDDAIYFELQSLRFKFDTADAGKWLEPITNLFGAFGIALPDLGEMMGDLKNSLDAESILAAALTAIDCVKSFTVADGVISVNVLYGEYAASLNVTFASDNNGAAVNVKLCVDNLASINATVTTADEQITEPDYAAYSDVTELIPAIESAVQIVTARGISTVATVAVGDLELSSDISATIDNGELKVIVTEQSLGLKITLVGDTAYIEVGGIKVSGQLADITALIDAIIPNLPYTIRQYVAKMSEQMMSIMPTAEELGTTDGEIDISSAIGTVLGMIKRMTISDGEVVVEISRGVLSATLGAKTDLSSLGGNISMTFDGIGGPFGDHYVMAFDIGLDNVAAAAVTVPQIQAEEYVAASDIIPILKSVLPLVKERALELNIDVTVFGQTIFGDIYVDFGEYTLDTIAVKAKLTIADATITLAVIEKTLYLDINGGSIRLAQPLTKDGIKSVITQLDEALPELGLSDKLTQILDELKSKLSKEINVADILEMVTLSPIDGGMTLQVEANSIAVTADIVMTDGIINIGVACDIDGKAITIELDATKNADGVIIIQTTEADVMGTQLELGLKLAPADYGKAAVDGDYLTVDDIVPYINPIMALVNNATEANAITIYLSGMTLEVMGKTMAVSGKVDLSLNPMRVYAVLTLFAGTADEIDLTVIYSGGAVYIELGEIKLKFDVNTDIDRLLEAVQDYLPPSLKNIKDLKEISKISTLIKDVKALTSTSDIAETLGILFDYNGAYGKSMAKQVLDMIRLGLFNGKLTASLTVMDSPNITLNVSPILSADGAYVDFNIDTAIMSLLKLDSRISLTFSGSAPNYNEPNADDYVSVVDFVTTVVNAVNTLTAKMPETETTENGVTTNVKTIAFSADSFAFDYDIFKTKQTVNENGETVDVTDAETGRVEIEEVDGKKVVAQHIDVNSIEGKPALAFKYVTTTVTENGVTTKSSKVYIEAHIELGIKELGADGTLANKLGFPIELNLFVAPTEQYPDGLAYLHYKEANGYGEKISLDYNSIMEIVAAVLDILSVDNQTVESLLGKYRLDIDKTVFKSMSIAGLDSITNLLNNLFKAVDQAKLALADVKDVLNIVYSETDIMNLVAQFRDNAQADGKPTAKALLGSAIDKVKTIIAYFATENEEENDGQEQPTDNRINGALFGKVVNAVSFAFEDNTLTAFVDNNIATGTEGTANVAVKHNGKKIDSITVDALDVNKAKLNKFGLKFTAGADLFADGKTFDITVPEDELVTSGNTAYSDFGNIKHLLFDVMNTANMLEFEIGGGANDGINVTMNIPLLVKLNMQIDYNVKVKIIETDEVDDDGDPIYKTAAAIEIHNHQAEAQALSGLAKEVIVPDCTTRLYFYDDVIYIQGVRSWQSSSVERVVGTVTDVKCIADVWGKKETRYPTRTGYEYTADIASDIEYVEVMYTVDELFWMMSNDLNTFLNEFVYYLIPIKEGKILSLVDIRQTISDQIGGSSDGKTNTQNTLAQIFKSYNYDGSAHKIVIGLAELAGSSSLSDLTINLVGANDGDRNVLDNYISSLGIHTDIAGIISVDMNATLNNVRETDNGKIESKGFAPSTITQVNGTYTLNGVNYAYSCSHYDRDTLYTLDGKTYLTPSGNTLYIENGSFVPTPTDESDVFVWTSTGYNKKYCKDAYKFGDTGATYYYTTSLSGYGYRCGVADTYYIGTDANGNVYVYRMENGNQIRVAVNGITTSVLAEVTRGADGKIATVTNRVGGIQWSRPWKAAYDAAQAA